MIKRLGADIVSVLHIAAAYDHDLRKVTIPALKSLSESATSVWKNLVKADGKYISIAAEQLFGNLSAPQLPEMKMWLEYIQARDAWVQADVGGWNFACADVCSVQDGCNLSEMRDNVIPIEN